MTHDELLLSLDVAIKSDTQGNKLYLATRAVVKLHYEDFGTPNEIVVCDYCKVDYPRPTIQAIEKELA